jgi:hypothetical protein
MKPYTKTYLNYFGYDVSDFIPCEVCGGKAVDINHLEARSRRKDLLNDINNLMAMCRQCHIDLADKKQYKEYLQNIHNQKLKDVQQP